MSETYPENWEQQVKFMRDRGITSAQWDGSGRLLNATLGPDPHPQLHEAQKRRPVSAEQAAADRRRVMLASSGRLIEGIRDAGQRNDIR